VTIPRKWRKRLLLLALPPIVLITSIPFLIDPLGGASSRDPGELASGLSVEAMALVQQATSGLKPFDHHTHLVGLGDSDSGCFVNPAMRQWWHITRRIRFEIYKSASRITNEENADAQYVQRLVDLIRNTPGHGKHLLLAFDQHYTPDGKPDRANTELYTPNDYVFRLVDQYPDCFEAGASVHPYRTDAVQELKRCAARGARVVKWLPNAMGMDPASPRCDAFYRKMVELGLVLLTHAGEEKAVHAEEAQKLGNPLRLRRALDAGVTVIIAHCAGLGTNADLDNPSGPDRTNFDLFLRLMDDPRHVGRLFGEISAITQANRLSTPLRTLLTRTELHARLVNGSDYPLPAINVLVRTSTLVSEGFLTEAERTLLNEIFDFNPLLFDFVLKRTIHGPNGERFPAALFERDIR
jgi:predicted TIM-barrel fold metal-dependent hydrolase